MTITFDSPTAALGAHFTTAQSGLARLQQSAAMEAHMPTLNGVAATLRWLHQAQPISPNAYYDLRAIAEDVRAIWEHVRTAQRAEAGWLCDVDVALQGAARTVFDALSDRERDVARLLMQMEQHL